MAATPAFGFLVRLARGAKPRRRGLTVASDKAKSLAQARDIIETVGDIIGAMRHGLHRATDYDYYHACRGKTLPAVPPVK